MLPVVDTFTSFLVTLESTQEVLDYVKTYVGESREALNFAKLFLEKRPKLKDTPSLPASSTSSVSGRGVIKLFGGSVDSVL